MASQERAKPGADAELVQSGEGRHAAEDEKPTSQDSFIDEMGNPEAESALDSAIHTLIAAIRQEFARERRRERQKLKTVFQQRIRQLEIEANQKVREKLSRARVRDKEKLIEREQRLDTMFAHLNDLVREIAKQKQALKESRADFEQKLAESDLIQSELQNLGKKIGERMDTVGDSLPDDRFLEQMDQERKTV